MTLDSFPSIFVQEQKGIKYCLCVGLLYHRLISDPAFFFTHFAGCEAAGAGLQPGQVILKVNGTSVNRSEYQEVLEHFAAQHTHQEPPQTVSRLRSQVLTYKSLEG